MITPNFCKLMNCLFYTQGLGVLKFENNEYCCKSERYSYDCMYITRDGKIRTDMLRLVPKFEKDDIHILAAIVKSTKK